MGSKRIRTWELVTDGIKTGSLSALPNYEEQVAEGQKTKLDLVLTSDVLDEMLDNVKEALEVRGIPADVSSHGNTISIVTQKGMPWLGLLAVALISLIILAILLVAWKLWKEVIKIVPEPLIIIGITAIIVIAIVIAAFVVQRRLGL